MHENRIVVFPQPPGEYCRAHPVAQPQERVGKAGRRWFARVLRAMFFAERVDPDIVRELVLPFKQTNDANLVAMSGKLLHPSVEKP